jgi:tripartite-type tricarboxylate transporter receptor subunit TctC
MVWYGIIAPKDTPRDIVMTLNKAVGEAISDADFRARLADTGGLVMSMTPEQFEKFIEEDIERWRKVVDFAQAWIE